MLDDMTPNAGNIAGKCRNSPPANVKTTSSVRAHLPLKNLRLVIFDQSLVVPFSFVDFTSTFFLVSVVGLMRRHCSEVVNDEI